MTISNGAPSMILKDSTSSSNTVIARNSFRDYVNTEVGTVGFMGDGDLRLNNKLSKNITFYTNNAEKMRISSSGNLLVNRTSDAGYKLDVNGTFRVSSSSVFSSQITAGYGVKFTNGDTDFLLYNNSGEDVLYMRDTTNGAMITTWGVDNFTVNKKLLVIDTTASSTAQKFHVGRATNAGLTITDDDATVYIKSIQDENATGYGNLTLMADDQNNKDGYISFNGISGGERARITSAGNLLVGTTSGSEKLVVNGRVQTSAGGLVLSDTNAVIYRNSNNLELITYAGYDINLMPAGNTGIGTTSPSEKLEVTGNIKLTPGTQRQIALGYGTGIRADANTDFLTSFGYANTSTLEGQRGFKWENDYGSVEHMRLLHNGNLLINTTTDDGSNKLQVAGTASFVNSGNGQIDVTRTSGATTFIQSQSAAGVIGTSSNHNLDLKTNGSTRLRLTTGGNTLLGTTTDAGVRLYVNGVIRAVGGGIQAAQDYGFTLNDESGSNRYGLKFGAAGTVGGSNLLMLTNRSFNSATGGGEVAIGGNTNTSGVTEVEIARFIPRVTATSGTQKKVSLDAVLELTEQTAPADPASGESIIWMDSESGDLKVKINYGGTTVTRTLASFE